MKKVIASLTLVLVFSGALIAQTPAKTTSPASTPAKTTSPAAVAPAENPNAGDFLFTEETWDFGKIPQNKPVTHDFTFKNTGKEPIVISNCQASCGCTVPKWPKEPILPGKSDVIQVTYNAAHAGGFNKSITITSNAKSASKIIYIKGEVEAAPVEQTTPEKQPSVIQPSGTTTPK